MLIFNKIDGFSFYKKILSVKKNWKVFSSIYLIILEWNKKAAYFCDFSCNKKSAFSPRLDRMH